MAASDTSALRAIARQLLAELHGYEQDVDRMIAGWPGDEAQADVDARMARMRQYSNALFGLCAAWGEVLIAQAELMQFLCRVPAGRPVDPAAVAGCRERVRDAADSLRTRVLWRFRPASR